MFSLDLTSRNTVDAAGTATAKAAALVAALANPVTVRVYNGAGTIMGQGGMLTPWATATGNTVTVGEVATFDVLVTGTPAVDWYIRWESGAAWIRASFGPAAEFTWSLPTWAAGQRAVLGTLTLIVPTNTATNDLVAAYDVEQAITVFGWTIPDVPKAIGAFPAGGGTYALAQHAYLIGGNARFTAQTAPSGVTVDSATGVLTVGASVTAGSYSATIDLANANLNDPLWSTLLPVDFVRGNAASVDLSAFVSHPDKASLEYKFATGSAPPSGVSLTPIGALVYDGVGGVGSGVVAAEVWQKPPPPPPPGGDQFALWDRLSTLVTPGQRNVSQYNAVMPTWTKYWDSFHFEWHRSGGDWTDRDGVKYGTNPWATIPISAADDGTYKTIDVTALATHWFTVENTGIYFHPGTDDPVNVVMATKENVNPAFHPSITYNYADGTNASHPPSADLWIRSSAATASWATETATVTSLRRTLMQFPTPTKALTSASLRLYLPTCDSSGIAHLYAIRVPFADTVTTLGYDLFDQAGIWYKSADLNDTIWNGQRSGYRIADVYDADLEQNCKEWTIGPHPDFSFNMRIGVPEAREVIVRWEQKLIAPYIVGDGCKCGASFWPTGAPDEVASTVLKNVNEAYFGTTFPLGTFSSQYLSGNSGDPQVGGDGWSMRLDHTGQLYEHPAENTNCPFFYVYHLNQAGDYGDGMGVGKHPSMLIDRAWHVYHHHMRVNTPGVADGWMRLYKDDILVLEQTGMLFRSADEPVYNHWSDWDTFAPANYSTTIREAYGRPKTLTATVANSVFTFTSGDLEFVPTNTRFKFEESAPAPLSVNTAYRLINLVGNTFQIATSGGTVPITITGGPGPYYCHRELTSERAAAWGWNATTHASVARYADTNTQLGIQAVRFSWYNGGDETSLVNEIKFRWANVAVHVVELI